MIEERIRRIMVLIGTIYTVPGFRILGPFTTDMVVGWSEPHSLRFQSEVGSKINMENAFRATGATIEESLVALDKLVRDAIRNSVDAAQAALVESSEQ